MNDEARSPTADGESVWSFDNSELFRHSTFGFRHFYGVRGHVRAFQSGDMSPHSKAHMCSITLSPNCEHLISVAPSIKRAKSYVTRLLVIAPLNPLRIRSAASVQPM